jgi:tetraprenyl-beta-curcumene synthase
MTDPAPLSARQLWALLTAATRELAWGLRAVASEMRRWERRASMIPPGPLRDDALGTLASKRAHIVGAALFWILPARRDRRLLRLLVAYEVILEFLDDVNERAGEEVNGRQLHRALVEALDPFTPISDYYRFHPWSDDGGYLRALVESCREGCLSLPDYATVRGLLLREAERCGGAQSLNHGPLRARGATALQEWSEREFPGTQETAWWELSAAASSSMGVHALLALAASDGCGDCQEVNAAYVPWICALSTMLDSYVDQSSDSAENQHSYLAHYPTPEMAADRIYELIQRSAYEARRLPNGHRHCLIAACMVAMYLSSEDARSPATAPTTARFIEAGGSLTRLLVPILRLWRVYSARRFGGERRSALQRGAT